MTLTELKEDLIEFLKEKGIYIQRIDAQIEMGTYCIPEIHIQLEGILED